MAARSQSNLRYSMSRFNNQLPCEPLSNAEFCKAQLIRRRNERLANCDSPQILPPCLHLYETSERLCECVCVCWAWGAAKWKANKQLQSGAESSASGWPCSRACTYVTRVYRCVRVQTCVCVDRCGRAEGSATGLKDDVNQRAILIWL